ncbi:glycoside hydrolase family 2 TIM barrel-domain containing protein [Granulicella sibirica]|uniref:Beta-galactosidase n=1 Tax=Granulicella sibirica TaxID=2479048 RepID=A0A4V1L505_9BACT|nr:glycoside hydrolase family 2 TIM barrel-domain containing protein [Granulicella sibirica]RXH54084.1 Beta-galactosidase [Granulicella sibirica]
MNKSKETAQSELTRREFMSGAVMAVAASKVPFDFGSARNVERESSSRRSSFDSDWRFVKGDVQGAQSPDFHDEPWSIISVPHDWSIEGEFREDAPGAGFCAYLPTGIGWYRRHFAAPPVSKGGKLILQFDGVYQRSEVWINGHSLGMRPYGFISFAYDLTPYLHAGRQPNVLAVRVDNSLQPNCRWYSGSGIYRHTWLLTTEPVHIAQWGTCVRTPQISTNSATVEVSTRVQNDLPLPAVCSVRTLIQDRDGATVKDSAAKAEIPAGGELTFVQRVEVASPKLWSVVSPYLYSVHQVVEHDGRAADASTTPLGIRSISFDVDKGFLLNGEPVKLNGVCLHGDAGAVGTAVPERMWARRLALLKDMGCNAIRCSHNPPAPEFLDLCDTMGFMVMFDAFDEWHGAKAQTTQYGYHKYFDEWAYRDLKDMILRDRNHPSIVIWNAGNEVPDQGSARGVETLRTLKGIFYSEDPTRPVTVACDMIAAEPHGALPEFLAEQDVVGYNYVDRWRDRREKFYSIDRHQFPNRRFIGTESVALRAPRGSYKIGAESAVYVEKSSNLLVEVEQLQRFIQTYDYVSGDFIWTGIDYLGEATWPAKGSSCGVLDTCGFRKDSYYFYQSLWTSKPVLHLSPHWNWKGHEGTVVSILCYTNCDTVELFVNGKSWGVKGYAFPSPGMEEHYANYPARAKVLQTTADLHLSWDVPYEAGTVKAVGTKNGQVVSTVEVATTGEPARLFLSSDRVTLDADGRDVAHVTVEVRDSNGRCVPTADHAVTLQVRGEGKLLGMDNGDPVNHESYKGTQHSVFHGLCLALIGTTERAGAIEIVASSRGLAQAALTLTTRRS